MLLFRCKTPRIWRIKTSWRSYSTESPYSVVHKPVMLTEVVDQLSPKTGGLYCDLTFGDGGYTRAILDACDCQVVAVDQDPTAYEKARQMADMSQYKGRLFPMLGRFGQIDRLVQDRWSLPCFDGMVMDIGVSSSQLETPSRGFSYKLDGPLDMRMFSRGQGTETTFEEERGLLDKSISAYEVVNFFRQEQIADIIYQFGGDRLSRKIARAIVTARQQEPIETTSQLAALIHKACPQPRWQRGDDDMVRNTAARTFQAIRIYVNNELGELESALRASEYLLKPGGNLAVVTFHSLEDRMVKRFLNHTSGKRSVEHAESHNFRQLRAAHRAARKRKDEDEAFSAAAVEDTTPEGEPSFEILTRKPLQPSREERAHNARSRSSKLRAAQRTTAHPLAPFGELRSILPAHDGAA